MLNDHDIPMDCTVDRERGLSGNSFAICAPYADGLPGSAVLGCASYLPHATLFSAASDLLLAAEKVRRNMRNDVTGREARNAWRELSAAIDKARGA